MYEPRFKGCVQLATNYAKVRNGCWAVNRWLRVFARDFEAQSINACRILEPLLAYQFILKSEGSILIISSGSFQMYGGIRIALFKFAGGFAIADLYSGALRQFIAEHVSEAPPQKAGWFSRGPPPRPPLPPPRFELDTLRGDLDAWVEDNQILALAVVFMLVVGGGPASVCGAVTCIAFDGESGQDRYVTVKDHVLEWWDGVPV